MAAPCRYATRSAAKGFCQVWLQQWAQAPVRPSLSCLPCPQAMCQWRHLHGSHTPALTNMKVESHKATGQNNNKTESKTKPEEDEEEDDGPEYIPKRKAKNPMIKIGYAWMIGLPTGIISFILAKREVDKNRLKQLRIRQRMKNANEGEYESNRYRTISKME
ncbi:DUF4748 domain-containing protein [Clupea harengus]|uniref:DUF4748 domain-containing protein n=1 Tax=Clupea harengus TaxID=7950 RepID=A0A8M1KWN1_CLUHA|nr:DUF4748 domain-containing protein [Clupea harengus]